MIRKLPNKDPQNICRDKLNTTGLWVRAFVWCAVVKPPKGVVLRDVWVEELERVLWDHPVGDDLVVPDDVGERKGVEAALGVRLDGVELHLPCWDEGSLVNSLS